jgi:hypothetical protein
MRRRHTSKGGAMSNCLLSALAAYIMVAFINMELNAAEWGEASRFTMIVFAMFIAAVLNSNEKDI